jgi:hypothetical protein
MNGFILGFVIGSLGNLKPKKLPSKKEIEFEKQLEELREAMKHTTKPIIDFDEEEYEKNSLRNELFKW